MQLHAVQCNAMHISENYCTEYGPAVAGIEHLDAKIAAPGVVLRNSSDAIESCRIFYYKIRLDQGIQYLHTKR